MTDNHQLRYRWIAFQGMSNPSSIIACSNADYTLIFSKPLCFMTFNDTIYAPSYARMDIMNEYRIINIVWTPKDVTIDGMYNNDRVAIKITIDEVTKMPIMVKIHDRFYPVVRTNDSVK